LDDWKEKQQAAAKRQSQKRPSKRPTPQKGKLPGRFSASNTPASSDRGTPQSAHRESSRRSTVSPQQGQVITQRETETSEYIPSQKVDLPRDTESPTLRTRPPKKRQSSFGVVIPKRSLSRSSDLQQPTKQATPEAAKWTPIPTSLEPESEPKPKKRRLAKKVIADSQEEVTTTGKRPENPIVILSSREHSEVPVQSIQSPRPTSLKSPLPVVERASRSKSPTPTRPRNKSLSPVTKVGSWLDIASDNDYEEAIKEHEQSQQGMNPSNLLMAPGFTPIQSVHRQNQVTQSNLSQAGSPVPRPSQTRRSSGNSQRKKLT
jgi:hypothetical protein